MLIAKNGFLDLKQSTTANSSVLLQCGLERDYIRFRRLKKLSLTASQWALKDGPRLKVIPRTFAVLRKGSAWLLITIGGLLTLCPEGHKWHRILLVADMVKPMEAAHLATRETAACAFLCVVTFVHYDDYIVRIDDNMHSGRQVFENTIHHSQK